VPATLVARIDTHAFDLRIADVRTKCSHRNHLPRNLSDQELAAELEAGCFD
jgi:hypothetical protein